MPREWSETSAQNLAGLLCNFDGFETAFRTAKNSRTKHKEVMMGLDIPPKVFEELMTNPNWATIRRSVKKEPATYGNFNQALLGEQEFPYFAVYDVQRNAIVDYIDREAISCIRPELRGNASQ